MLTRDLLRFSVTKNGEIFPRFVDVGNRLLLDLAGELIELYSNGTGRSRVQLEELTQPLLDSYRAPMVARGLNKLLLDRCQFQEIDAASAEGFRQQVFTRAAQLLNTPGLVDLPQYRAQVARAMGLESEPLSAALHADHPDRQLLQNLRPITAERLLHRYNLAQPQGLLMFAERIQVTFQEQRPEQWRPLFRHLKFCRLLAQITRPAPGQFQITVEGPLTLFHNLNKYGLQLAQFFPAICDLNRWSLRAEIRMPTHRAATLNLDQDSGLRSHLTGGAFVPEAFAIFARQFAETATEWQLSPDPHLLPLAGSEMAAPDFTFVQPGHEPIYLELFHRWHKGALQRRLRHFQQPRATMPRFLLGVDRALAKEPELAAQLDASKWFEHYGFLFNEFPPVSRVRKALEVFDPPSPPPAKRPRSKPA